VRDEGEGRRELKNCNNNNLSEFSVYKRDKRIFFYNGTPSFS